MYAFNNLDNRRCGVTCMKFLFRTLFLFISFAFFSENALSTPTLIIVYRDFNHKGDENQAKGVVQAFKQHVKDVIIEEFNLGKEAELHAYIQEHSKKYSHKPILLAVGEKTVDSFSKITPIKEVITIHLCHMITKDHKKLLGKINFMALPVHALKFAELNFETNTASGVQTKLISTIGVSHNRQGEVVDAVYQREKARIPDKKSYFGVILAGDAPTPEGMFKLFTKTNAQELANYVAHHLKDRHLLIINGPRTGKFKVIASEKPSEDKAVYLKEEVEELKTSHRNGQIDYVTQAFLDELQKRGISEKQMTLFDFQVGSSNQDMDLVLGVLRATSSEILVPGESTSAISEAIDILPQNKVTVYHNTAMNDVHMAHIESELRNDRIDYLKEGFQSVLQAELTLKNPQEPQKISAAETIAKVLKNELTQGLVSNAKGGGKIKSKS